MSSTFVAGSKLRAIDMVPQKIWTVSSTSTSTAIGTTETVINTMGTAPSTTYRAGRAYLISMRFTLEAAGGALDNFITIRDTNASGTIRMGAVTTRIATTALGYAFHYEHYVVNSSGSDITGRVLVLTNDNSTNTCAVSASASRPAYWSCIEMGAAADFPEAVAL